MNRVIRKQAHNVVKDRIEFLANQRVLVASASLTNTKGERRNSLAGFDKILGFVGVIGRNRNLVW